MISKTTARRRRFLQFSLKTLLALVTAAAVPCGWFAWKLDHKKRERAAVAEIQKIRGHVYYQWPPGKWSADMHTPRGPEWLRKRLGDDFFSDVVGVLVSHSRVTPDWLRHLEPLTELKAAYFTHTRIGDDGMRYLTRFKKITELHIDSTVSDAGLAYLCEFPALTNFAVPGGKTYGLDNQADITDVGLSHLKGLKRLEVLFLSGTHVTDDGLAHVSGLVNLTDLTLEDTAITDRGLVHLEPLTRLKLLSLRRTKITAAGRARIQKALPNCTIYPRQRAARADSSGSPKP